MERVQTYGLEGEDKQQPAEREPLPLGVVFLALGLGVACTWWGVLHEVSFYYMATYDAQANNCFAGFLGGGVAGLLLLGARCFTKIPLERIVQSFGVVVLDGAVLVLFYMLLQHERTYVFATMCYFVLNVSFFSLVSVCIANFSRIGFSYVPRALAIVGVTYAVLELVSQGLFFEGEQFAFSLSQNMIIMVAHLVLVVASFLLIRQGSMRLAKRAAQSAPVEYRAFKPAPALLVVALFYSIVFGIVHNLASGIVDEPTLKVLPSHIGLLLGGAVFYASYFSGNMCGRIWTRFRQVSFPLTMISFILLPLSDQYMANVSVVVGECATLNFYLVFLLACVAISKRACFDPIKVSALGISVAASGFLFGDALSSAIRSLGLLHLDAMVYLTAFAFVILIAATFWTGDDRRAALLWGMEEKRAPRKYDDVWVTQRAESLVEQYGLSTREGEILHMFAQGKTPQQITEELFITMATVRSHTHKIHVKLGVHSHAELMSVIEEGTKEEKGR